MSTAEKITRYTIEEYYEKIKNHDTPTELRNGEIASLASPSIAHQRISMFLSNTFYNFIHRNKGKCEVFSAPTDVKLNNDNIVVPDIFITCKPENFDNQKYNGSPDLIIEIISTNWADDYCRKLTLYQSNGVREYWIVDPGKEIVTVYFFEQQFIEQYKFSDDIPVNIYNGQMTVNISELLA